MWQIAILFIAISMGSPAPMKAQFIVPGEEPHVELKTCARQAAENLHKYEKFMSTVSFKLAEEQQIYIPAYSIRCVLNKEDFKAS